MTSGKTKTTVSLDTVVYETLQKVDLEAVEERSRSSLINRLVRDFLKEQIDENIEQEHANFNRSLRRITKLNQMKEKLNN